MIGVTTLGLSAMPFLEIAAATSPAALIPPGLIAAFGYGGWRQPGVFGCLLILFAPIVFAPIGTFLVLLGSTNLDPASQVIFGLVWWAGLPLLSGALLIALLSSTATR